MKNVVKSINDILNYTPTKEEIDAYEDFKKQKKEDISNIPELKPEQLAMAVRARNLRKTLYKPVKVPVKIN